MNPDLRRLLHARLSADGLLQKNWVSLVFAASEGRDALEDRLTNVSPTTSQAETAPPRKQAPAYLASLTVQGFRGIGPKQTIAFTPGPSLTVVIGPNGSGKSSFAEALEVLFTGDARRWSDRTRIWKEGWRNLHHPHPASIEAEVLLEGYGQATVMCAWEAGSTLDAQTTYVQGKGARRKPLRDTSWRDAVVSHRPFLSYHELGSMLEDGPSKLHDTLSLVLGLEDLVNAQAALGKSRLERQHAWDAADEARETHVAALKALLHTEAETRAVACLGLLTSNAWDIDALDALLATSQGAAVDQDIAVLTRALALEAADGGCVRAAADALREADLQLKKLSGTDAEHSRQLAQLLEAALVFHDGHGDGDCPVCGTPAALEPSWRESTRREVDRLRGVAAASERAHSAVDAALRGARKLLTAPPGLLTDLFGVGVDGLDAAREQWDRWHAGSSIEDLTAIASHLETHYESFARAIAVIKQSAATELRRREDRWRPVAAAIAAWTSSARSARAGAEPIARIKAAEQWLKEATAELRNERFEPIADQAMAIWRHLRQQSSVELQRIALTGAKSTRRVTLDVVVDGSAAPAFGVMSQGELHALALSLFLPRATLSESPFRFVVIDDPVQAMDAARVDGLANALADTARTRQVIVFTQDERLVDAMRRLNIPCTILGVTRRPGSLVDVRPVPDSGPARRPV